VSIGRAVRRRLKALVAPAVFLALTGYFGWNATTGDLGLRSYALRQKQLAEQRVVLAQVEAEQAQWERRVDELRGSHLDADMLDERARAMLNLAEPGEIVVPYGRTEVLFR
jgi:cell division protein FtsB